MLPDHLINCYSLLLLNPPLLLPSRQWREMPARLLAWTGAAAPGQSSDCRYIRPAAYQGCRLEEEMIPRDIKLIRNMLQLPDVTVVVWALNRAAALQSVPSPTAMFPQSESHRVPPCPMSDVATNTTKYPTTDYFSYCRSPAR